MVATGSPASSHISVARTVSDHCSKPCSLAGRSAAGDVMGAQHGQHRSDQFAAIVLGVGDRVVVELPEFGPFDFRVEPADD